MTSKMSEYEARIRHLESYALSMNELVRRLQEQLGQVAQNQMMARTPTGAGQKTGVFRAVVTTAITSAPGASTVGQGVAKLRNRTETTLSDGDAGLVVYNDFAASVAVGKRIMIARDPSGDYMLVSGDCPG